MAGLELNTTQVAAIPAGFNYAAVSELGKFSALNADRTQNVTGFNFNLKSNWVLNGAYFYGQFKDRSPYLLDATGRMHGIEAGISYVF